jgi:23S rRNA (adenine2503-C2)-methyltransferase
VPELLAIRPPKSGIPRPERLNLRGLSFDELVEWIAHTVPAAPKFRAKQVFRWLHHDRVSSFAEMTNVSAAERGQLGKLASLDRLTRARVDASSDKTRKLVFETADERRIESVLIPNDERGYTLCISSQVGCALTCRFCATASLGFERNLDTWEIVDQVYGAIELLEAERDESPEESHRRLTNLVYMGMGEPLHNFNQVKRSLAILTDKQGIGIASRRITVSTAGLVPAIERFGREGLGGEVGLAISLNATTDAVRDDVMPINTRWNIAELLAVVTALPPHRRRDLTFEYVLLADVNDTDEDVVRLARLVGDLRGHVNVIPFNPHPAAPYARPSKRSVQRFMEGLHTAGVRAFLRTPRGDDIGAACGQLALQAKG